MLWYYVMWCYGIVWCALVWYDMMRYAMGCYDLTWHVVWCDALCYTICYDLICDDETMVWYCMMCYVTVWYVMIWHVMIWHEIVWWNHDITCSDLVLYDKIWWYDMTLWVARPFPRQPLLVPVIRPGIPRGPPAFIQNVYFETLKWPENDVPSNEFDKVHFSSYTQNRPKRETVLKIKGFGW